MPIPTAQQVDDAPVPITGRRLKLPDGPILHLQRAHEAHHEIGEFRAWAGYKNLGTDLVTDDLVHFQHVLSFADTETAGRTGVHTHLAHVHIVIPCSGRGVFSYDGVVTDALPGSVIVQHGGTVHDQFQYSYVPAPRDETGRTPVALEPAPADAPAQAFGFLEIFVPKRFANIEIVPPAEVTPADQATAWDHPYHAAEAGFFLQAPDDPGAAYRPLVNQPGLEVRCAETWERTGAMVATWILRPAAGPAVGAPASATIPGESGGVEIYFMAQGSARLPASDGGAFDLAAGDTLTCSQGLVGDPVGCSHDMSLLKVYVSPRVETLRERTPEEIRRLEALGPAVITRYEVRAPGDTRPVNFLQAKG
jgi:mannose-6-phosphate isomerase-like protein (cupin superfamily)